MAATISCDHETCFPIVAELQLPSLGGRRAGIQYRHVDAACRPGLAGSHPAHAAQRVCRGHGDGAAVRTATAADAVVRLCRRSFQPAQASDRHPGHDGCAGAHARRTHGHRTGAALACLRVRLPVRLQRSARRARTSDVRGGAGGRGRSVQRDRAEFHLVQCRTHDRTRGRRPCDRLRRYRLGLPVQWCVVHGGADVAVLAAPVRTSPQCARPAHQGWRAAGVSLCQIAIRSPRDLDHAVPDRHLRNSTFRSSYRPWPSVPSIPMRAVSACCLR